MTTSTTPYYCPALRAKGGELAGLLDLEPEIAERVRPRLIVPPPSERDNEFQASLLASGTFPDVSRILAGHWRRSAFVDATYLMDEFGRDQLGHWFPLMFERARAAGAHPIPLVSLRDLLRGDPKEYSAAVDSTEELKFGLVVSSGDLTDSELVKRGLGALEQLGLSPDDCAIIADFHDSDFSDPALVAPVIEGVLETLRTEALWRQVIFQGTNFPEKNPAEPNSYSLVPRNEWIAWRRAVTFDPETADQMIFGDYAADCAKINFGQSGGRAIRHYRYAIPNAWLVQRGADQGSHRSTMRQVCKAIVSSGKFCGRDFSVADEHIYQMSRDSDRSGTARDWRATNITHHVTMIVTDLGEIRGIRFARRTVSSSGEQMSLLNI